MVNLTSFLMIYTFVMLPLIIIKEFEANEILTLKILTIKIDTLNSHGKRMERSKYHDNILDQNIP